MRHRLLFMPGLGLAALLCGCGQPYEVETTIGYLGKARSNPFLAAQRFLESYDYETKITGRLPEMPPAGVTLFVSAETIGSQGTTDRFLEWVDEGGHLIYVLDGTQSHSNDFSDVIAREIDEQKEKQEEEKKKAGAKEGDSGEGTKPGEKPTAEEEGPKKREAVQKEAPEAEVAREEKKEPAKAEADEAGDAARDGKDESPDGDEHEEKHPLLNALGITINKEESGREGRELRLELEGEEYQVDDRQGRTVALGRSLLPGDGELSLGEASASKLLSVSHGYGRVTILSDAWIWRNRHITEKDHAALLLGLMDMDDEAYAFWVLRGADVSFFGLLWTHGWRVLVVLALLLVLWLWRGLSRFGRPIAADTGREIKDFSGHVGMTGRFLWRFDQSPLLIQAARDRLRRLVEGKLFAGVLPEDPIVVSRLSQVSGLPEGRVLAIWAGPAPVDPTAFVGFMQDLQEIEARL